MSYAVTKSRIAQWIGIILVIAVFAGAYWYFQVYGSTLNAPQNDLVANGLVGLWSFNGDDMSGNTVYDRSSTGANGTLTSGPTVVKGKVGQALDLDGTDDYVSVADNVAFDVGDAADLTLSGWLYRDTFTTDDTVIAKRNGIIAGDTGYIAYIDDATDQLIFEVSDGIDEYSLTSVATFTATGWYHYAIVWDQDSAANSEIYVNGLANSATDIGTIGNIGDLSNAVVLAMGAESDAGDPFDGKIDEVRAYNRVLAASEIQSLYTAGGGTKVSTAVSQSQGTGRLDSGLAGYWALDDGTSGATPTSATDSSTNANTGTLTNGPTWITGQIGSAVDFDGTDDYITVTDSSDTKYTGELTLCVWANIDTGGAYRHFVGKHASNGSIQNPFDFRTDNAATPLLTLVRANSSDRPWVGPSVTLGAWKHYCVVAAATIETPPIFYVDGVSTTGTPGLGGSGTGAATGSGAAIQIGTRADSVVKMDGKIDEVRIYSRMLSANEVAQLYRLATPTSVDTSLKGYWSFNSPDVSGTTAYDRSGVGNTGTLTNGPTKTIGKLGQALNFDGSDDYMDAGTASAIQSLDQLSVASWVYIANYPVAGDDYVHAIVSTQTDSGALSGWTLSLGSYGIAAAKENIYFEFRNVGNTAWRASIISSTELSLNTWYHVVATYDQVNIRVYVNGMLESISPQTEAIADGAGLSIGRKRAGTAANRNWDGRLDETRVYNRALSASEIKGLYDVGESDKVNSAASQAQGTGRLDSGLAGYWKLDDGSGASATDNSTNENTGTLTNGPTWTTGQIGGAVSFDGTDDYINVPDPSSGVLDFGTNNFSVSIWFKTASTTAKRLMNKINATPTGWLFDVNTTTGGTDSAGGLRFGIGDSGVIVDYAVPLSLNDNSWHLATATVDRGSTPTLKIYADGIVVGSTSLSSVTGSISNAEPIALGVVPSVTGNYYNGQLDEARIYNRALSSDEVARLYRLTAPTGIDTNLKGYWSFNGPDMPTGTTAADRSGAGNTGTLTGNAARALGKIGQGMTFDGSGDYVDVGDMTSIEGQSQVSFAAWVKPRALVDFAGIFGKQFSDSTNDLSVIAGGGSIANTAVVFMTRNGSSDYGYTGSGKLAVGTWTHVVATFDGSQSGNANRMKIYINGVSETLTFSGTIPATTPASTTPMTIGRISSVGGTYEFNGFIDEARIYNRTLSAGEAAALYNQSR